MNPIRIQSGFTLIELLVVISILGLLLAILMPSLSNARLQAKVLTTNAELYNIGVALESYGMENKNKFPPTRFDCNPESLKHFWAMPRELVESGYMAGGQEGAVKYAKFQDRFNSGLAYKYIAPGPMLSYYGDVMTFDMQIPNGFPSQETTGYKIYSDPAKSPVTWMIFSVGPQFDMIQTEKNGFPVSQKFWYPQPSKKGLIVRTRLLKGKHIGTFEASRK